METVRTKETTYPRLGSSPYAFDRSLQKYLKHNIFDSAHIGGGGGGGGKTIEMWWRWWWWWRENNSNVVVVVVVVMEGKQ